MSSTEHLDELEHRLSELVKDAVQQVKDEFKEKLRDTRQQVEEIVGKELSSARETIASVEAESAQQSEAVAAAEQRASEAGEALAAAEARIAEISEALGAAEARAGETAGSLEAVEAQATEAVQALEAAEARANEAAEALAAAEARASELGESLEASEARVAELTDALSRAEEAAAEAASTPSGSDLMGRVMAALGELDQGRSQAEVLEGLLSGAGDFSSRSAVFLTGPDGLKGWGHRGFGGGDVAFDELVIAYDEGSAQSRLANGRGVIAMSDEECATLCDRIDGSRPQNGVLIPIVLANRLAAALYADQFDDNPIEVSALQLLAYVSGQALETLPLREGGAGVTLQMEGESATEAGLELWDFAPPAVEIADSIEETADIAVEQHDESIEVATVEESALEVEEPGYVPEPDQYQQAEDTGFEVEAAEEAVAEETLEEETAVDVDAVYEVEAAEQEMATEQAPEEPAEDEIAAAPDERIVEMAEEAVDEEATEQEAAEVSTEVAPPAPVDGAQVAPPEDLDGPGWAFQTRSLGGEGGEDAAHEEARRLARLLVTEIKLYNEEQVEEGRRNRNIYQSLRDDIDRSRQIYEERVDEGVRTGTDYFHDELVRILAAGESEVLGV